MKKGTNEEKDANVYSFFKNNNYKNKGTSYNIWRLDDCTEVPAK